MMRGACLAILLAMAACAPVKRAMRGYAQASPETFDALLADSSLTTTPAAGGLRFAFDDFGSLDTDLLSTYGVPWKLASAALVLAAHDADGSALNTRTLEQVLAGFGFVLPDRVANLDLPKAFRFRRPVGLLGGVASRRFPSIEIEVGGLGCAACHAGSTWDEDGRPTREVWLGLPNTSLDLGAWGDSVFATLRRYLLAPDRLLQGVRAVFPTVSQRELRTLEKHAIPTARTTLDEYARSWGRVVPFENGGPGMANGVASVRHLLDFPATTPERNASYISIPFIGGIAIRSSLLADGVYAPAGRVRFAERTRADVTRADIDRLAGIAAFFMIPALGASPAHARAAVPGMRDVVGFLQQVEPPPFPGPIDSALARHGAAVYRNRCAYCHGEYSTGPGRPQLVRFPNRLVPVDSIGTDRVRVQVVDSSVVELVRRTGFERFIAPARTGGYVAPRLDAVWATAPYLHNGSVPTLWHLLHPECRPRRFEVGGHALDFEKVGIAGVLDDHGDYGFPHGYTPRSRSVLYDTSVPGRANTGHERQLDGLYESQKRALLEYLKTL